MKKLISFLLAVIITLGLTSTALAVTRDDILKAFPGYEYSDEGSTLRLKDFDPHEAPELTEGDNCLWVMMADGSSPLFWIMISGSQERGMPNKLFIRTLHYNNPSKEYEIKILGEKVGENKIVMLRISPYSDLVDLVPDMLSADRVTVTLRNNRIAEDEVFDLNDAQKQLLKMTYSYYRDVINAALKRFSESSLKMVDSILASSQYYTVEINPYEYKIVGAINGTGGLYPWLTHYMQSRYPDYNLDGKDVEDFITYIIGKNGLGLTYDQLYNMLAALDEETAIHTVLDSLTGRK